MESTLSPVIANIIGIIATAGGLALIWLLIKASSWVSEKIQSVKSAWLNERNDAEFNAFFNTKEIVIDMIQDIVDALNVTFKKELAEKSESGTITKEDGKRLLNKAIELAMAEISENQMEILETGIGDIEEWLRTRIEMSVEASKTKNKDQYTTPTLDTTSESNELDDDDLDI